VYSEDVAVATYPGTVSPLRGLDSFGEAERDVWYGREGERDELAKLVTTDGFRAGLLFGEPGVGKTSLIRAGLIPHLRDHGTVALACEDLTQPAASFAAGLSVFGIQPAPNELPVMFAARAVANAVAGQQFVFVVDDVDLLCADDRATAELSDLFSRVVSRSGGRARFLFTCASERMNVLGALEKRTGSLFPPSTRYELGRFTPGAASKILDLILSFSGVAADPALADAVVQGLSRGGPSRAVLPADLQIAGLAMRELRITSAAALGKLGGPSELESAWLHQACKSTGNERSALRLCAELAAGGAAPRPAEHIARRINLDLAFAHQALTVLEIHGVIIRGDAGGATWMLRHEVLIGRVKELTAPARAAARKAFDLLGSKTASRGRLSLAELRKLRNEGIAAVTPEEASVLERSKRYYMTVAAAIAAVPIALLVLIWFAMHGRVHFALAPGPGGDHVVVRGGRAGLHAFFWLPGGFGDEVADTGLTRGMVAAEAWKKIDAEDIGAEAAGWDALLGAVIAPQLAGLVEYATTGNEATLETLKKAAKDPEDLAELLTSLRPIARGTPGEVQLVESALTTPSPAVQRAAVAVAGSAAQRRGDVYQETLSKALTSPDPELRRIAFASVRSLGDRGRALFSDALAKNPDPAARRELLVEVSTSTADDTPSPANAVAVLADPDASPPLRERARAQIKSALVKSPEAAATALTGLLSLDRAPIEARVYAIEQLREVDPRTKAAGLVEAARAAFQSRSLAVRAAALPLYAKVDPVRAGGDLYNMLEDKKLDRPLRIAAALAWGEVAPTNREAAQNALDRMLKDDDAEVRAAAATAAGKAGRAYQDRLYKMAKAETYAVRIGAAQGLAASAESGGSVGVAIDGIAQLWREKGRPRRDAARIFAHLARRRPPAIVIDYLAQAARTTEDLALHPIGVEGLCNAALAGSGEARARLARSAEDASVEVRRLVMACAADGPDPARNGVAIAIRLVRDPDSSIRSDAARVLAMAAAKGSKSGAVNDAIVQLLDDPDRNVRVIAVRAVGALGGDAPKAAATVMGRMFERGDEAEKLALVRAARQIGAAELIGLAVADGSPLVRVEAVDAALASGLRAGTTLAAALADSDPTVRKAALQRLAAQKDKLEPAVLDRTLALAVRDPNPELSQLALTIIARVAAKDAVVARLHRALGSRAESERAHAAAAAIGLVDRDAKLGLQLLDPLIDDASHDVRSAMLPALAAAYAKTSDADKLAAILRDSETAAMRRLVAAAGFVVLARTDSARAACESALGKVAKDGPPMAQHSARLVLGLIAQKADGMAFLQQLVP
jgi:HEAT repeat protein